jgi:RNA polymerase sigma-70 factor (ECF subfamily)
VTAATAEVREGRAGRPGDGPGAEDLDVSLDAARAGDERGFVELWSALNPLILRYLKVVVDQSAEDVASETWLQAARDVRGFRGDASGFRVWLFRVARHRALDELRRSGRRLEDPAGLAGEAAHATLEYPAADDTAAEAVERLSTQDALRMIARLPKDQAEAVLLRAVVGLDGKQCADVLGKKPGAVRIAAMRGLRNLSGQLAEQAADPAPELPAPQLPAEPRGPGVDVRRAGPRMRAVREVAP